MKKNKIFLIIPIVLIIAVAIAAIIYYCGYYLETEQVYKRAVNVALDSNNKLLEKMEYSTYKSNMLLDLNLEANNEKLDNNIVDLVNNLDISLFAQINKSNKELILDLESDYNKQDLLNIKTYTNVNNKETYAKLKDFLNKYFRIEVNNDIYSNLNTFLEVNKDESKSNIEKLKNELGSLIKTENCSSSKEEIEIDGKLKKVTKDTLKIKAEEFINILKIVYEDIEVIDYENVDIEFNIYTSGILKNKVEQVDILISNAEESKKLSIIDDIYYYEIINEETNLKGNVRIEEKDNKGIIYLVSESNDFGILTLQLDYALEYDTETEVVDISNNSDINGLTKDEQFILLENFEKSKLYSLISNLIVK